MKRGWVASLLVTATIALAAWANVSESRAAPDPVTVRLCYKNVDSRPWYYRRGGGLDFQLLDRAGKRAGVIFRYESLPWQACLDRLHANQVDGAFGEDSIAETTLANAYVAARGNDARYRLHTDGETAAYLFLAQEFKSSRPDLAKRILESVEAARASAAYRILERQTLTTLGKAQDLPCCE